MFSLPIATSLRSTLRHGYSVRDLWHDFAAAFTVSMLALPLAMALAIAVGLAPQHGIYTAIVAGIAAPLLGGSRFQVSGPTAAFVVIVAPIVAEYGLTGLLWCEIGAGILLILMGCFKLGRFIRYVPYPVTTGFTAGIALVIATISLNDFLGLNIATLNGSYVDKLFCIAEKIRYANPWESLIGITTLFTIFTLPKYTKKIPAAIVGMLVAIFISYILNNYGFPIATIGNRFAYETSLGLCYGIPPTPPQFYWPSFNPSNVLCLPSYDLVRVLVSPMLVVAILAGLESLLSASVADSMTSTKHDPDSELTGIGLANILAGFTAGIPATGAIARTALNIHSGAKSCFSCVLHALLIMLFVLMLAPLISLIPMAALAALLISAAYRMSHLPQIIRTLQVAPSGDKVVLMTCLILTSFVDMVVGVGVGIVLACFLFMQHMSELSSVQVEKKSVSSDQTQLIGDLLIYRIDGPLFFGNVEKVLQEYHFLHDHLPQIVLDLEKVPFIDMTGMNALKNFLLAISKEGRTISLCAPEHVLHRIRTKLQGHHLDSHVEFFHSLEKITHRAGVTNR